MLEWTRENFFKGLALSRFFDVNIDEDLISVITPSFSSRNIGDEIIADAVMTELTDIFPGKYILQLSSHAGFRRKIQADYNNSMYRFWGGANMLDRALAIAFNYSPDIPVYEAWTYRKALLLGTGLGNVYREDNDFNFYAKIFYNALLSKKGLHSVRDEKTKTALNSLGFDNVICTGCPTTWRLTNEHCSKLPMLKADRAVFTITDYKKDAEADKIMIRLLQKKYKELYFFPQGSADLKYFYEICPEHCNIKILPFRLKAYDQLLENSAVDYIGTRLHGGIRSMQKLRRTVIIGVDNRAADMNAHIKLPLVMRSPSMEEELENWIDNPRSCRLDIDIEAINSWKAQFAGMTQ